VPGAAIEACERAARASPDLARVWFELGRGYWMANRDAEAFAAFVRAAKSNYAPAMKYIGDAYLEGRGLPSGEDQDVQIALQWYKKSNDGGFKEGGKAFQEATDYMYRNTFDQTIFQNQDYMARLYNDNFENIQTPILFMAYLRALVDELGGDKILYVDSNCKPLITAIGDTILSVIQAMSYLTILGDQNALIKGGFSILFSEYAEDQGKRDAVILVNRYGCKSAVAKKIVNNIIVSYSDINKSIPAKR
jgi:TPR repeat protein